MRRFMRFGGAYAIVPALIMLWGALGAGLAAAAPRQLLGNVEGQAIAGTGRRLTSLRERPVKVDLSAIAGMDLPNGADVVALDLFADVSLSAEKSRFERRDASHFTWFGKVSDDPQSMVILVGGDGVAAGSIFAHGKHYSIRGGDASSQEIVEIDQSAFPREACDRIPEAGAVRLPDAALQDAAADSGSTIDVMVVYTPSARVAQGGTTAMSNLITLAVAETNASYANSGVSPRLNLVHAAEVTYTESGNWDTDLSLLQGTGDGSMDVVHTLRDTYRADVVVLLINDFQYCGLASAILATSSSAFCLVAYDCASGNYSFGHEIGHLQGARHDWYVDPTDNSPFSYNHGDIDTTIRRRTVMSYDNLCQDTPPGTSCTRVPYWSNPAVDYPSSTRPAGSTIENNATALNTTAVTVANFRQTTKTLTVASTFPVVGVQITVTPADAAGLGTGTTGFTRSYATDTAVTLTAPTTADGNPFSAWSGCASTSGPSGEICSVTMDVSKTVTANYVRDTGARPTSFVLWSRSDTGQASVWELDPDTGALQSSVWMHSSTGVGSPWLATSFTRVDASTGYLLWTRSDTGQAALWRVNPATGAVLGSTYVLSSAGVGAPWQATSYAHVDSSAGYVLWTRSDTGQAALWKVNPASGALLGSAFLYSATGVGGPWQATSFSLAGASTGTVLWTRGDTGQAVLWTVNATSGALLSSTYLYANAGIGSPWRATSYQQVSPTAGYLLWTRSDTGQAAVWEVNPTLPTGVSQRTGAWWVYDGSAGFPASLVGAPWQAVSYVPVNTAPTVDAIGDVTVGEDAGLTTVNFSGVTAGSGDDQTVTVTVTSSNTAVIPTPTVSYTSPNTTGSLNFTPAANATGSATITVWISDGQSANSPVSLSFTVTVTAVNDDPTGLALSSNAVDGGLPSGTAVGTFSTTDPDAGDTFTYTLVSGTGSADNASFSIVGNQLRTAAALDYVATNPYSIRVRSTDAGALFTEQVFTIVPPAYALWTRGDTGQTALWRLDPATGALLGSVWISASGVGSPWRATSYAHVDGTEGYVLWTRSDTGQAALWRVNPASGSQTASAYLLSASGVGGPWQATSYSHVDAMTGYVLWTRSDTGQASLWRIDPSDLGSATALAPSGSAYLLSVSGVGAPWQASSFAYVDATTGYVLWTRSDTGQASLWRVDPSGLGSATALAPSGSAYLLSASGVGAPWQASSFAYVSAATGYVLWTRGDTGQASRWRVDPSGVGSLQSLPPAGSVYLYSSTGVGGPWQASSYFHPLQQ